MGSFDDETVPGPEHCSIVLPSRYIAEQRIQVNRDLDCVLWKAVS